MARDAAKYLTMHRLAPTTKTCPSPNVNSAGVEKTSFRQNCEVTEFLGVSDSKCSSSDPMHWSSLFIGAVTSFPQTSGTDSRN